MTPFPDTGEPVRAVVWYCLNNYCYEDAVFLAERLHAEVSTPDTSYLLATCYYRSGRVQQAKHHLSKEDLLSNLQCSLLYGQCCLELKEYKSGLAALKGLLCLHEASESDIVHRYGNDAGVAFNLLGRLNLRLNLTAEAVRHFTAAIKYNPFLWSAYECLCDLGESVSPDECFTLTSYPPFLKQHHSPPTSQQSAYAAPTPQPPTHQTTTENSVPQPTAFTPIDPQSTHTYITPDLFGRPVLGKAVASSTPTAQHAGTYAHDPIPFKLNQDTGSSSTDRPAPPNRLSLPSHTELGDNHSVFSLGSFDRELLSMRLGNVRGALDFGSGSGARVCPNRTGTVTPLAPSFGVVPLTTPSSESTGEMSSGPLQALNFDTITPSPTALPPDYLKMISSAPRSTKGKTAPQSSLFQPFDNLQNPSDQFEASPDMQGSEFTHPLMHSTTVTSSIATTNQNPGTLSHDVMTTHPKGQTTPTGTLFRVPAVPKSSVRRSARLAGSRRLTDHGVQSTRGKPHTKIGPISRRSLDSTSKKPSKVTFHSPVTISRVGHDERQPPSPKAARLATPLTTPTASQSHGVVLGLTKQPEGRNEVPSEGVSCEGVSCEGVSVKVVEEWTAQRQASMEQEAMVGLTSLMQLLRKLGMAYRLLSSYDLGQAIHEFQTTPPNHYATPWVISMVARAYFAGERFKKCATLYEEVHRTDPHRQEGMELYSSALWHLQKEVKLSVVAETLHSSNRTSPQALCAMSTVMNLYKDHGAAIKYLQRIVQVSPQFMYAHTLLGHEWWLAKDYDKSLASFQEAVTINPRHYNAWYGMAHVYFAQEKYSLAETYATKALTINKNSSIACTQIALAQFHRSNYNQALRTLNHAISINSTNPIPKFHKAKVLEALGRLEESLQQLDQLSVNWPKEPNLYVTKGKILRKLNRIPDAILHFSWARDFGKTDATNQIRDEIDQAYHMQTGSNSEDAELSSFTVNEDLDEDDSMQS